MHKNLTRVKVGTRGSKLALAQTHEAISYIKSFYPFLEFEIIKIVTKGDAIQDKPLYDIGGKALFTKEIESALINGDIDIAVHSAKDVESQYNKNLFCFPCVLAEEDNRDVFISKDFLDSQSSIFNLNIGDKIGTCSVRRQEQISNFLNKDISFIPIRGNINTRLDKLAKGDLNGIVLAYAGLKRLGLFHKNMQILEKNIMLPAVSQGIITIQAKNEDRSLVSLLSKISHKETDIKFRSYRAFVEAVDGSCTTPLGADIEVNGDKVSGKFFIVENNVECASHHLAIECSISELELRVAEIGSKFKKYL
jgi:hydroxymethylbilane synthase